MADWDPELYERFRRYRAEPAVAMLGRLEVAAAERIVDLGCGPGQNTVELARRAKDGAVLGIDSSPRMVEAARRLRAGLDPALAARLSFELGDITEFNASGIYSLIFSNAALQWVPGHRGLFAGFLAALRPRGRIAIQMPANEHETAKVELYRLASEERWRGRLGGLTAPFAIPPPDDYAAMLREAGFTTVDCYYQTFEHLLNGPAEVVQWYKATGLRPFLERLVPEDREAFLSEYAARLERAYGTRGALVFTFRRLFIWGNRPSPG